MEIAIVNGKRFGAPLFAMRQIEDTMTPFYQVMRKSLEMLRDGPLAPRRSDEETIFAHPTPLLS